MHVDQPEDPQDIQNDLPPSVTNIDNPEDEEVLQEKGKAKLEVPNYENFSVEDLHPACLDRLATSREMEIGLVGMMKNKYEEALKTAESGVANLKKDLEKRQTSQAEVEEKLRLSLIELENTWTGFLKEKQIP